MKINKTGRRAKTKYNSLCQCGHRETQHFIGKFGNRRECKKMNCPCQQYYDQAYLIELKAKDNRKLYKVVTPKRC